jgi:hypothetical protein
MTDNPVAKDFTEECNASKTKSRILEVANFSPRKALMQRPPPKSA